MSLKIQCLMLLLAVVLFKTSECWESDETRPFQQEDNEEDNDYHIDPRLLKASVNNSAWPFHQFLNNSIHREIIENLRKRHWAGLEREFLSESTTSPISSTDIPTSTHLEETTLETSTEHYTEPSTELSTEQLAAETTTESRKIDVFRSSTEQLATETTTESRKVDGFRSSTEQLAAETTTESRRADVFRSSTEQLATETTTESRRVDVFPSSTEQLATETTTESRTADVFRSSTEQLATETTTESRKVDVFRSTQSLHATEPSTKPTTTTTESFLDRRVFSHPRDLDGATLERYVEQRRIGRAGLGPMPKRFVFTDYEYEDDTDYYGETKPIDEKLDEDFPLVVGEIFNVPVVLKIEIQYNDTYKLYVPHHAVILSHDINNGKMVRITWAVPNAKNYTIVFGRAQHYNLCYFAIITDWNKEWRIREDEAGRYQLIQRLMSIEDEIKLRYGITVKITTVNDGTSLQQIYRNVVGCPVMRGSPLGLYVMSFILPVTILAFFILRAYCKDSYPQ